MMLPLALMWCLPAAWTVVIDPGHGGYQPGARAGGGRYEKHLTLEVAEALKRALVARGYKVILTRDDDRFVSLGGRSRFANAHSADVMISLHANDAPGSPASGIETYFLSSHASDAAAQELADKENQDPTGDVDEKGLLGSILSDLRRTNARIESELLAARVQGAVVKATGAKNRGVKQAPLAVLKRTEMAAVLVEIGFLTNKDELHALFTDAYQARLADGLASGIDRFMSDVTLGGAPEMPPPSEAPLVSLDRKHQAKAKHVAPKSAKKKLLASKHKPAAKKNVAIKKSRKVLRVSHSAR